MAMPSAWRSRMAALSSCAIAASTVSMNSPCGVSVFSAGLSMNSIWTSLARSCSTRASRSVVDNRSEERRVGKEGRSRRAQYEKEEKGKGGEGGVGEGRESERGGEREGERGEERAELDLCG